VKRVLRWLSVAFGALVLLALLAFAAAYALSERALRRVYPIPAVTLSVPSDPASVDEGGRLARIRGCVGGCHGRDAEGAVMFDEPMIARLVAPNLTASVKRYDDAQLAVIIRNGVRPDGRSMLVMPSEVFNTLTDADLARILAFLRSLPPRPGPEPGNSVGPLGRVGLALGEFKLVAQQIEELKAPPEAASGEAAKGRYLARTVCAQCHGTDLRGGSNPEFTSPDLRIAAAYSPEAFSELMRTGAGLGGRKLPVMGPWARNNLSRMTDDEIAALYAYLHSLPGAAQR
jgi:mono/diheme cytochrome c family protein